MSIADLTWSDMGRCMTIVARMQFQADEERPKLPELLAEIRDAVKEADASTANSSAFSDPLLAANEPGRRLLAEVRRVAVDIYGEDYARELFERITK